MNRDSIEKTLNRLAQRNGIKGYDTLTIDMPIVDHTNINSLLAVKFFVDIERVFGIEISDNDLILPPSSTKSDIVFLVLKALNMQD